MVRTGFFPLMFLCFFSFLNAQTSEVNPFDLTHRLGKTLQTEVAISAPQAKEIEEDTPLPENHSDVQVPKVSDNPFDLIVATVPKKAVKKNAKKARPKKLSPIANSPVKIDLETQKPILFWFFTFMLIYLAITFTLFRYYLTRIYRAFANDNFLKMLQRDLRNSLNFPYWFFYLFFFFNAGIFLFQIFRRYGLFDQVDHLSLVFFCILFVGSFFLIKQILLRFIGYVFPLQNLMIYYSFMITIFSSILGIALFPINVLLGFAPLTVALIALYIGLVILVAAYLYRYMRGIIAAGPYILFYRFHFFIYLCTVEIAPALVFIKLVMQESGF